MTKTFTAVCHMGKLTEQAITKDVIDMGLTCEHKVTMGGDSGLTFPVQVDLVFDEQSEYDEFVAAKGAKYI